MSFLQARRCGTLLSRLNTRSSICFDCTLLSRLNTRSGNMLSYASRHDPGGAIGCKKWLIGVRVPPPAEIHCSPPATGARSTCIPSGTTRRRPLQDRLQLRERADGKGELARHGETAHARVVGAAARARH